MYLVVGTNARRLPGSVVSRRVRLVQLESIVSVPPCIDEGDSEGPEASVLSVALLQIADLLDQLLHGDGLLIRQRVPLCGQPGVVDEDVGVSSDSSDAGGNVSGGEEKKRKEKKIKKFEEKIKIKI